MLARRLTIVAATLFALSIPTLQAQDRTVPTDLRPLLAKPASEMRLVVTRYTADRGELNRNYAGRGGFNFPGGGRGGGGRGAAGAPPAGAPAAAPAAPAFASPISQARLARLKRYDLDWQAALAKLNTARLSPAATADLDALKARIAANLKQLEDENLEYAQISPATPFGTKLVALIEARIRVDDVDPEKAARTINEVKNWINTTISGPPEKMNAASANRAAEATETLRLAVGEWNSFYDGYDPMFSWWMRTSSKQIDQSLTDYAKYLREKVADASTAVRPTSVPAITPAAAPKIASVPDLNEIISLPQDEMRDIVARFNQQAAGAGRGGRGGGAPAPVAANAAPSAARDNTAWLEALKTLDFDALSRNAQVDYLYIKWRAETDIRVAGQTIPPGPAFRPDASKILGKPRGREGLISDLRDNMIPYTPEQLMVLAEKEFAWCENEMKKASRQLGYGDDWKKALEHVKETKVPPGGQPRMIMGLLNQAVDYLRANDLVTVPGVAAESLKMTMLSPEAQLTSPFFLGGDHILVSYPTDAMDFDARMQSMRGNNPGFSHATAFHEMIPGHNLVGYMNSRYADYRARTTGGGPFYGEGYPLYWELTMYELGFDKTPEEKIGALFWRMHRCARIIFSFNFHMGIWTPGQAVDFLVDKVGHERDNAAAEVRRSFESAQYQNQPLYQAAYLLGGLQLRGLRKELIDTKQMTNKAFHDEILRQGNMPMALVRLNLTKQKLTRDMDINWKFYGELPEK
ncbi:MAG: DUF885 family protein [Acidobacteria bacterium]|nr:DUF885 family protein [Acidobacteriota bacterium]